MASSQSSQMKGKRKASTQSEFVDPINVIDEPDVVRVVPHNRKQDVWCNWDLVEMVTGELKARCKLCGTFLKHDSNSTLKKHVDKKFCKALKQIVGSEQAELGGDGSIFHYNSKKVHDRMAKYVIQEGLPFNHFDNPRLTSMIRETLQPRYTHVSRTTLKRHCLKLWEGAKKDLIEFFGSLKTGVNITSDVWSAPHNLPESYLCVTAHWVDPVTWQMMKRTIAFESFTYPHTADKLFSILDEVLTTFNLRKKVFSMSFDNASNNTAAVDKLYLKYSPACYGKFFHTRCVAHIINLVVQDGLAHESFSDALKSFRFMLQDVFKSGKRRHLEYKNYCKSVDRKYLAANWDVPTRWNSTCHMLSCALSQKQTLRSFHKTLVDRCEADMFPDSAWVQTSEFLEFLDVFKTSTTKLSGVYYPTSCWVLLELFNMSLNFKDFEMKNPMFESLVVPMKKKFRKYFENMPPMFTCATALHPYFNVSGVESLIQGTYDNLDMHEIDPSLCEEAKESFNNSLKELYDHYFKVYGPSASSESSIARQVSKKTPAADKFVNVINMVVESTVKKQRGNTPSSELGRYTGTNYVQGVEMDEIRNFDILAWWKGKQNEFPILSAMARDLLSVQASTVASESVFSLSGRVLSMRRTKLSPESLEMCICLKDHLDAVDRIQHKANLEDEVPLERHIENQESEEGMSSEDDNEEDVIVLG